MANILMSLEIILLVFGALFILVGILEKLKIGKWVNIDPLRKSQRLTLIFFGCLLLSWSFIISSSNQVRISFENTKRIDIKSDYISDFNRDFPRNTYGQEWKVFNDSKWFGKSIIWYELVSKNNDNEKLDNFMRIHYQLGDIQPSLSYCGVYTEFSDPPYGVLDLSSYNGIEFDIRYKEEAQSS